MSGWAGWESGLSWKLMGLCACVLADSVFGSEESGRRRSFDVRPGSSGWLTEYWMGWTVLREDRVGDEGRSTRPDSTGCVGSGWFAGGVGVSV